MTDTPLLATIKKQPTRAAPRREMIPIDVALAWARGDIGHGQIMRAMGITSSAVYQQLAFSFRTAIVKGMTLR